MDETRDRPVDQVEAPLEVRALRRVRARTGFLTHLAIFVVANVGLYVIWRVSGARYPWFLWVLFGWGIGLVGHALTLVLGPDSPREQRAIAREIARIRAGQRSS